MNSIAGAVVFDAAPSLTCALRSAILSWRWFIQAMESVVVKPEGDRIEVAALDAVRRGDRGAYDVLVAKYMRKALSISWGIVRDIQDAEDLTQEAFLRAFEKVGSMKSSDAFGPWLFRIVSNLSLDLLRKRKRRPSEPLSDVHAARERSDAPATERVAERIDAAIEALPEMQRIAARLYLVEGFSHAEIAAMLNLREASVRSNLFHARRKLQEQLSDIYEDLR